MREMQDANGLLGDKDRLARRFEELGYLYLREVLDATAVNTLGGSLLDALKVVGVVAPDADEPIWNDRSVEGLSAKMRGLQETEAWKAFRDQANIERELQRWLGCEYRWLPLGSYRIAAPVVSPLRIEQPGSRFKRVHQDSDFNHSLDFTICWVPLSDVGYEVGGIAVAEGHHNRLFPHETSGPAMFSIKDGTIPEDAWVWAHMRPTDILVMRGTTPHTAILNHSNRFRLSIDFRFSRSGSNFPLLGHISSIDCDHVSIATEDGGRTTLIIDDQTVCPHRRGVALQNGGRLPRVDIPNYLVAGQDVLATAHAGVAVLLRRWDLGLGA